MTIYEYSAFVLINFDSFNNFPNLVFNFTLHVDVFYLLNGILADVRGMGHKYIAAASSGIAATLLRGGGRHTASLVFQFLYKIHQHVM